MRFADKVEFLGRRWQASCSSWGRTAKRNEAVGGAFNSRHKDWLGADLVLDAEENKAALINDARALGLWVLDEGDHVHVQEPR